jgi:hypothetical protein
MDLRLMLATLARSTVRVDAVNYRAKEGTMACDHEAEAPGAGRAGGQ